MRAYFCRTRGSTPVSAEARDIDRRLRCQPRLERAAALSPARASSGPAALVARLRVRSRGGAAADDDTIEQFKAGFSALAAQPVAMAVMLLCALGSAVCGASTVLYVPLPVQLGTGASGYGYLLAGPGDNQ